ncbi:MAG TPA: outer spore coat protein CotE [Clostridia bacterium]|nr:outer spore coat protein CotE [Clostridia bacterium]
MEEDISLRGESGRVRTIITNAVYGSATQICNTTIYINPVDNKRPTEVLGCTVKGAQIKECSFDKIMDRTVNVRVNGTFEVHVWYEAGGDTYVAKNNAKFSEVVPVKCLGGESYRNKKILSWISQKPTSLGASVVNKSGTPTISVQIEYGLGVEVMGEAMLNVISYHQETGGKRPEEDIILNTLEVFNVDAETEDDDY